jgi:hypothetical protein
MTVYASKSLGITNSDATPMVPNTTGQNGQADLKQISDFITPVNTAAQYSTYRLVRFPSNAKVKHLWIFTDNAATSSDASFDIDVAASDCGFTTTLSGTTSTVVQASLTDGTPAILNTSGGTLLGVTVGTTTDNNVGIFQLNSANNKLFGAAVDLHAANPIAPVDYAGNMVTNLYTNGGAGTQSGQGARDLPMWQVLNFTSDPGGFFDIMLQATTEFETSNTTSIYVSLEYAE